MNEPEPVETLLRRMPLRPVPPSLDKRVRATCRAGARVGRWWTIAGAAAAAAVLALVLASGPTPPAPRSGAPTAGGEPATASAGPAASAGGGTEADLRPLCVRHEWTRLLYDGVVAPEGRPLARFRRQVVRHLEWTDPSDGAHLEVLVPREDVFFVEATLY